MPGVVSIDSGRTNKIMKSQFLFARKSLSDTASIIYLGTLGRSKLQRTPAVTDRETALGVGWMVHL